MPLGPCSLPRYGALRKDCAFRAVRSSRHCGMFGKGPFARWMYMKIRQNVCTLYTKLGKNVYRAKGSYGKRCGQPAERLFCKAIGPFVGRARTLRSV